MSYITFKYIHTLYLERFKTAGAFAICRYIRNQSLPFLASVAS